MNFNMGYKQGAIKESIKVDPAIMQSLREYCKANGIKYGFAIETAIVQWLESQTTN